MNLVLSGAVDDNLRDAVVAAAHPTHVVTLHSQACRLEEARHDVATRLAVKTICDRARVDHAYVAAHQSLATYRILAMDMDSTLITVECIDEIADFVGKKSEVSAITEAAMRGDIKSFAESLRRRVALLKGTPVDVLESVYNERVALTPGAEALTTGAQRAGLYCLLVSGGFTFFTERLRERLGFDAAFANELETKDGRLTGKTIEPVFDAEGKARALRDAALAIGASTATAIVIGDGANDLPMMSLTTTSVAFHAKPAVNERATLHIKYGGLSVALDYFNHQVLPHRAINHAWVSP